MTRLGKTIFASDGAVLTTVPDIPLCATGIEYPLSTGPATFTPEDLADAVMCQDDPAIHAPRLKIGHVDPRFNGPEFDGTPAFGKFVNLRLAESDQVLVADAVGVPKWLADIMPVAYPNRSIEGNMQVETVTGHQWQLVIWRVALLGVVWPGVSTLEDLPLYYGEEMPPGVQVIDPDTGEEVDVGAKIAASGGRPGAVSAMAVEDIRRAYYDSLDADQMWWWIRSMYLEPNELIVDADDGGTLYRVPFTIDGEEVEFSDPAEVKIQYVDAKDGAGKSTGERRALALVACAGHEVAQYDSRAVSRPDNPDPEEGNVGIDIPQLRARLGLTAEQLPDDATEEQINAAITGDGDGDDGDGGDGGNAGTPPEEQTRTDDGDDAGDGDGDGDGDDDVKAGMVQVPAAEWKRVQDNAAAGAEVAAKDRTAERDRVIDAAIKDGKIRPADRTSYENMHGATPDVFTTLLTASVDKGGLRKNIVPVESTGASPSQEGEQAETEYAASWLSPAERARIDAIKAGTHEPPLVQSDTNKAKV